MQREQPRHLIPLAGGWSLWRRFCLRGAGFAAELALSLSSAPVAAQVEAMLELERACERALQEAGGPLEQAALQVQLERARAQLQKVFEAESTRVSQALRGFAVDPLFREAITWQNRNALRRGVDSLLRHPVGDADSRTRQNERLLATYVQRYCLKNDTIGFFGPLAWGLISEEAGTIEARAGPRHVSRRTVYFEHWAIETLASMLTRMPGVRPWLRPRLAPLLRLEGTRLHTPLGPEELEPLVARLLVACNGQRRAMELAEAFAGEPVLAVLEELAQRELIFWRLEVPTQGQPYENSLRAQLESIQDPAVRRSALAVLTELEALRDQVARAAGDAPRLELALRRLDESFTQLTGEAATRKAGQTYAGRTLLYEDCQRDLKISLGPAFVERLSGPLRLLLEAHRWCGFHVAQQYTRELRGLFHSLKAEAGEAPLELASFWSAAAGLFPRMDGQIPASVQAVFSDYQRKWAQLLDLPAEGTRQVERSLQQVEERGREVFKAPGPGWPTARYHSPDLLVAAADLEAIHRGDFLFVLGELHASCNIFEQELYAAEFPSRQELLDGLTWDLPEGRLAPVTPKEFAGRCHTTPMSQHPRDMAIEFDDAPSWRHPSQTVPMSQLIVVESGERLVVRTRDGSREWDLIAALDLLLTEFNIPLLPEAAHTPRITLEGLVLCRESWTVEAAGLTFATLETPLERFVGARRWARELGLPRFTFFKTSGEAKPCFLDLDSPLFVECFTKLVKKASKVSLSEMLPTPEQCWLVDGTGRRYTSELRLVAVDPEPWRAQPGPPGP